MTVGPESQHGVWVTRSLVRPVDPKASDSRVTWSGLEQVPDCSLESLLDDFCALAQAEPDEMAAFCLCYAIPDGLRVVVTAEDGGLSVRGLRRAARAIAAARRVGAALVTRRPGSRKDWMDMQGTGLGGWVVEPDDWDDWKLGRERFSRWLTKLLQETGTNVRADWLGTRGLGVEPEIGSFMSLVATLLAREVGAEGQYTCDSCGRPVYRARPPRTGERVYCDLPECKREQRRRNQASWRARKGASI